MTVEWIEPIYDRTYGDVLNIEANRDADETKGCFNYYDLNRIENNTKYCMEYMTEHKIIRVPPSLAIKTTWTENDIPTRDDMIRIVRNITVLMDLSNPEITDNFSTIYESSQFTYSLANAMELNLNVMHDQPELPVQKWLLTLENGVITTEDGTSGSSVYLAENETATIQFVASGENAMYMAFTNWSGDTDDLQYVEDVKSQATTYTMQYHEDEDYEVKITGNYKIKLPRTLTLHGGTIYDDIGGTTRQFFGGDEVLLLADNAPNGKVFYEWLGTEAALNNINGGTEPSTAWLVMPDCDVELTSSYIYPGQHKVTVDDTIQGWYDYKETVRLKYTSKGSKWKFSYWSGSTGYLDSVTSMSLTMPDVHISFTSNWEYIHSYNDINIIDGTINGENNLEGAKEKDEYTVIAKTPEDGYGFYCWTLEGEGSLANSNSSTTTFTVGDGNAILLANYHKIYNVTVHNIDDLGEDTVYSCMWGRSITVSTSEYVTDHTFSRWIDTNGNTLSTKTSYTFTMSEEDVYVTAVYDYVGTYDITINNKNNNGGVTTTAVHGSTKTTVSTSLLAGDYIFDHWEETEGETYSTATSFEITAKKNRTFTAIYRVRNSYTLTVNNGSGSGTYLERASVSISAYSKSGYYFSAWSGNYYSIGDNHKSSTYITMPSSDCTMTANYLPEQTYSYYTLTVNNGSGSGTYISGKLVYCEPNKAPSGQEFSHWVKGDTIYSYANPLKIYVYSNTEITAVYKDIPYFDVVVNNGSGSGTYIRNSAPEIIANPAPEGYKFLQWEVADEDDDDVINLRASTTNLNYLTHNVEVTAVYYIPDPETKYVLSITNKSGSVNTESYSTGTQVTIEADEPDEGYKFYKWVGDTQYVIDKYSSKTVVNMPAKNIDLQMEYRRQDYVTVYHLLLEGGNCLVETYDDGTEKWDIEGEYEEGTEVKIKAVDIPVGYTFSSWQDDDDGKSISTVNDLTSAETTVKMEDFDVTLVRGIVPKDTHTIKIINGEVSGSYYEGSPVPVYFNLEDTDDIHYQFVRWSGNDIAYIKLFDTSKGSFNVLEPTEQVIAMPTRDITLTGLYTATYALYVNSVLQDYYMEKEEIPLSAEEIEGKSFLYWSGDTQYIDNKYNPNVTVTMPNIAVSLTAVYHNKSDNNSIGYTEESLYGLANINISDIIIISGEVEKGFLITDANGHMYIVTSVVDDNCTILQLTQSSGGEVDG